MPSADDFRDLLLAALGASSKAGAVAIEFNSGALHRAVGGYPGPNHRMPVCCNVMRDLMGPEDSVVSEPPKGAGASLTIRYVLPRG